MSWQKHNEAVRSLPVALTDAQMAEVGHELGELHAAPPEPGNDDGPDEDAGLVEDFEAGAS